MRLPGRRPAARRPPTRPNPNFESSCPVFTYSWVWASMPGVTRRSTAGARPSSACSASRRSSSSNESTTVRPTPAVRASLQLDEALVVAVKDEPLGWEAGSEGDVQLAAGRDVEAQPLLVDQPDHRSAQERLRGVDREVGSERGDGLAAPRPHVVLVVDEERSAVLGREVDEVDAADREPPLGVDRRGVGQEVARDRAHWPLTSRRVRARRARRDRWRARCARPRRATAAPG